MGALLTWEQCLASDESSSSQREQCGCRSEVETVDVS